MNHPTQEEWLGYLYEETEPATRQALDDHLARCPECAQLVGAWQETGLALDAWQLPQHPATTVAMPSRSRPLVRWAAAAAAVLAAFGVGRFSSPSTPTLDQVRTEISRSLAAQSSLQPANEAISNRASDSGQAGVSKTEVAELIRLFREARDQDRQQLLTRLQEIEQQRAADYASLRHDLETVAVQAENRIERTHAELVQLKPTNP